MDERGEVTVLLEDLRNGRPDAESRLLDIVYASLKRLARGYLRHERPDHTLQVTDLVHEVYLKMLGAQLDCQSQAHFFRLAAQAMRRILVDHARAHTAEKRGNGKHNLPLEEALNAAANLDYSQVIEVDEVLKKLAVIDPRQHRIVELRYFAGLSAEQTANVLGCSDRTVKREWRVAQAWLRRELSRGTGQ